MRAPGTLYWVYLCSMYIYYVYTTKCIGSNFVTRHTDEKKKKKQRYKIPSRSARDLKTASKLNLDVQYLYNNAYFQNAFDSGKKTAFFRLVL